MPGISKESALRRIQQAPVGRGLLSVFEAISREVYVARVDSNKDQELVTVMAGLRVNGGVNHDKPVTLFSNGLFTNVRVTDLSRVSQTGAEAEVGLEDSAVFSFEVGTFDRGMRRINGVDLDQAPFNGRVKKINEQLYGVVSPEAEAYIRAFVFFEQAFTGEFGSSNKMRVID